MDKPKTGKLKLFKTVIGFHDAYVAAASQKAALEAWGASTDLFSAKLAERVDDPSLCEAAFDKPGTVLTAKRGTTKEWTERAKPKAAKPSKSGAERQRLERKLAALEARHAKALAGLDRQSTVLSDKRAKAEQSFSSAREKLLAELDSI